MNTFDDTQPVPEPHEETSTMTTSYDTPTTSEDRQRPPAGPSWATVAFGLVCMALAGGALTVQLTDWQVDWAIAAPVSVIGLGAILVLVGLLGLATRRR